jgi:Cellulose biosynthesis protein BcsS
VVGLRGVVAAAAAAVSLIVVDAVGLAQAAGPDNSSFLLFAGTDLWRYGQFGYGGLLWSPAGLDTDGLTFKTLLSGGSYSYVSGGLQENVAGTVMSAAALPGWRFSRGSLAVTLFTGPLVQNFRLRPDDPGSHLRGFYLGAQFAIDIWYQPSATTMVAVNGAIASIGPTGWLHTAFGFRVFDSVFAGPESKEFWCGDFQELQLGGQLTGLHIGALDWSAGAGWSMTSDQRDGPYIRLGVNTRY